MAVHQTSDTIGPGNATSVAFALGSLLADDVVLASFTLEGDKTPSAPSGFTQLINIDHSSADVELFVYWKRLASDETGNYTFSWSGGTWRNGYAVVVRAGSTTIDPAVSTAAQGSSSTATA
jgi:hypothetical protein